MSLGGDSVIAAAATQATSTPVQPSTRKDTEANQPRMRNGLPYAERIDLPGSNIASILPVLDTPLGINIAWSISDAPGPPLVFPIWSFSSPSYP